MSRRKLQTSTPPVFTPNPLSQFFLTTRQHYHGLFKASVSKFCVLSGTSLGQNISAGKKGVTEHPLTCVRQQHRYTLLFLLHCYIPPAFVHFFTLFCPNKYRYPRCCPLFHPQTSTPSQPPRHRTKEHRTHHRISFSRHNTKRGQQPNSRQ